jgi:hypothetical protein
MHPKRLSYSIMVAAMASMISSAGVAQERAGDDKATLRAQLTLAHGMTYAVNEFLLGSVDIYSLACRNAESYTTLMMVDMILSYALETKQSVAKALETAAAVASSDVAAQATAISVVRELNAIATSVAKVMAPAKRCATFMSEKHTAANNASADGDQTWSAARSHALYVVERLDKFDATADIKAAQAIVEKTK